ncbi:MAG: hypothetical protein AB7T06_40365 [Kofleriaceae bacterium]
MNDAVSQPASDLTSPAHGSMRMSRTTADLVADLPAISRTAMRMSRIPTMPPATETTVATSIPGDDAVATEGTR